MLKAFNYMFNDNKFLKKAACYFAVAFLSTFLYAHIQSIKEDISSGNSADVVAIAAKCIIYTIIAMVLGFVTSGYYLSCVKSIFKKEDKIVLPMMNFLKNLGLGFKYSVSCMLLYLAIAIVAMVIIVGIGAIVRADVTASVLPLMLFLILFITIMLFVACCTLGFTWIFAKTGSWLSFYKFKTLFEYIKNDPWKYIQAILIMIGLSIIVGIICMIICVPFVIAKDIPNVVIDIVTSLVSALSASYCIFVNAYITAKCIEETEE